MKPTKKGSGFAVWIAATHILAAICEGQVLTKVVDPANPVVNDTYNSGGGSWIDVNNDGFLDLFVAHGNDASQNNSLYLNNKNGGFIKIRTGAIVNDGGTSIGSTWGDYDHDGMLDVFVTNRFNFGNFLYRGQGDTAFTKISAGPIVTDIASSNSGSWVDVDNDGDLDLFAVNFGAQNFLYRNSGAPDYAFVKIDTGLVLTNGGNAISGAWADYDNDRDPDLFIANGANENDYLLTNSGQGSFTREILTDARSTLGASWGDYDNDGDLDLFATNFLNQNNMLYRNNGAPDFVLIRVDTGIVANDGGSSVGSAWGDYDNDGDLDLFVSNDRAGGGSGRNFLYENSGPPHYSFVKMTAGEAVNDIGNSFGCSWADYDRDGDLDLFVANRLNQKNFLYRNQGNSNHWIEIKCVGTFSNRTGLGAKVRIKAVLNGAARWQMQEVVAQSGYNSQNLNLHFGLGDAVIIDSIRVEWPLGTTTIFTGVAGNQWITIDENGILNSVLENRLLPEQFILEQNYPNPFNPSTRIRYRLLRAQFVSLKIFDLLGHEVATPVHHLQAAGEHEIIFDASFLPVSGIYFYRITAGAHNFSKKMLFTK